MTAKEEKPITKEERELMDKEFEIRMELRGIYNSPPDPDFSHLLPQEIEEYRNLLAAPLRNRLEENIWAQNDLAWKNLAMQQDTPPRPCEE